MTETTFAYLPGEHEAERASNSYLMSVVALIGGMPLPIMNLIATFIFFLGNRKSTYFVRWHCLQAMLSQASAVVLNSIGFWWTLRVLFWDETVITNHYIAYMMTIFLYNLTEFIASIYCAIQTRKGVHVELWVFGGLTNQICKR